MDTAWGRRIYDQYEIEVEVDKPKYGYLSKPASSSSVDQPPSLTKKKELRDLGVWDIIFDREVLYWLKGVKKWEADHEEKQKALKKLKVDLAKIEKEVVIADQEDPVYKFKLQFCKTGSYLRQVLLSSFNKHGTIMIQQRDCLFPHRPQDMRFCLERTNFTEEQIIDWFKRFRTDCPDGKLTMDHLIKLFKKAFPEGDGFMFSQHILRIFDSDGNGFLDFKEFLLALDIATCTTEKSRLEWVFKLYDVDNDGVIDVQEMAAIMSIMETMESKDQEGSEASNIEQLSAMERAQNLFKCIEHEHQDVLTKEEFVAGYLERNLLLEKQDVYEQNLRLNMLVFRGHFINQLDPDIKEKQLKIMLAKLIGQCCQIQTGLSSDEVELVQLRQASENFPKNNVLVKFSKDSLKQQLWEQRQFAKKNGLILEEWLTEHRSRLFRRCKELKSENLIKDCFTNNGNVLVKLLNSTPEDAAITVNTDYDYEGLVKLTRPDLDEP